MTTGPRNLLGIPSHELVQNNTSSHHAALAASGELDLVARPQLATLLDAQIRAGRGLVWLDLSGVTFMDCSCLGVLVGAHRRLLSLPGMLVLEDVSEVVGRLLRITSLDERLFVLHTVPEEPGQKAISASTRATLADLLSRQLSSPAPLIA